MNIIYLIIGSIMTLLGGFWFLHTFRKARQKIKEDKIYWLTIFAETLFAGIFVLELLLIFFGIALIYTGFKN